VNQAVLKHLPPEHVEVEIWRADALEVRRGLSSELDEMWSYVRSKANPRCDADLGRVRGGEPRLDHKVPMWTVHPQAVTG
jgi:hypothetical protein